MAVGETMSKSERRYSKVARRIWLDARFRSLSAPEPSARELWLRLLTGPEAVAFPGLIPATVEQIGSKLGWGVEDARRCFAEIEAAGLARSDNESGVIYLPNALAHNKPTSPNQFVGWATVLDEEFAECKLVAEALLAARAFVAAECPGLLPAFDDAMSDHVSMARLMAPRMSLDMASEMPSEMASDMASDIQGAVSSEQEREREERASAPEPAPAGVSLSRSPQAAVEDPEPPPKPPTPDQRAAMVDAYHETVHARSPTRWPRCVKPPVKALNAAWQACGGLHGWREHLGRMAASSWLMDRIEGRTSIGWAADPERIAEVANGEHDHRGKAAKPPPDPEAERRRYAEQKAREQAERERIEAERVSPETVDASLANTPWGRKAEARA